MAKQNILNDSTTWGAEATKIEANFDELYNEKADHGYASIEVAKTLKQVEDNASVKIENLVVNGDFRNGTTGWENASNAENIRIDGGMIAYDSKGSWNGIKTPISIQTASGDKCYIRSSVMVNQDVSHIFSQVGFYEPNFVSYNYGTLVANTMKSMSAIIISSFTGLNSVRLRTGAESGAVVKWGKTSLINLTQIFGAGNEPTKEEFELLLSTLGIDYFEGEITIPAQKVMQWQQQTLKQVDDEVSQLAGGKLRSRSYNYILEQGSIGTSSVNMGGKISSQTRIRTLPIKGVNNIFLDSDDWKIYTFFYNSKDISPDTYVDSIPFQTGGVNIPIPDIGEYVCFVLAKKDDAEITPEDENGLLEIYVNLAYIEGEIEENRK